MPRVLSLIFYCTRIISLAPVAVFYDNGRLNMLKKHWGESYSEKAKYKSKNWKKYIYGSLGKIITNKSMYRIFDGVGKLVFLEECRTAYLTSNLLYSRECTIVTTERLEVTKQ